MKKIVIIIAFFAALSTAAAQDTITMFDSFYMYRPFGIGDSNIYCLDKDSFYVYTQTDVGGVPFYILQMYVVTAPTTIYGVAAVPNTDQPNSIDFEGDHHGLDIVAVVYAKEGPGYYILIDSIGCRSTPYHANIHYQDVSRYSHHCWTRGTTEFYFDYPCVVSDTCFIGIRCTYPDHEHYTDGDYQPNVDVLALDGGNGTSTVLSKNGYGGGYFPICDNFTLLSSVSPFQVLDSCEYNYITYGSWGGTFPIVGFHCKTAPEGFHSIGTGGGYCDLAWNSMSGDIYEVAVGRFGDLPDTVSRRYLTTDTTIRIDSLDPGTLYHVWVRGQCRYATVGIDTSLWSPWSIRMPVLVTAGIGSVGASSFTLTPNPASGTVAVDCEAREGTLEVVDLQGRTQLTAPATQRTLDISRLPSGSYFVRLTTPDGSAVRQLAVEN